MIESHVPSQVKLPLRTAASIVAQGIRIRLGRSLVTVSGVALGIAFLTSALGSQALRRGVAEEDRLREEANRMYGYLVAETGSLVHRPVALMLTSAPTANELRLLGRLEREQPAEVRWWPTGAPLPTTAFSRIEPRAVSDSAALMEGAACLIVLGDQPLISLKTPSVPGPIVAVTRRGRVAPTPAPEALQLSRELSAEERARRQRDERRARFRASWIVASSLLVTVIGIANAMLMSVTERFRDIGTMKCLGATSGFVRRLFLLEASFIGLVGGAIGVVLGLLVSLVSYWLLYDATLVLRSLRAELPALAEACGVGLFFAVALAVVAALYPARFASRMVPADALRSNV